MLIIPFFTSDHVDAFAFEEMIFLSVVMLLHFEEMIFLSVIILIIPLFTSDHVDHFH